jgi:hypothetical protein
MLPIVKRMDQEDNGLHYPSRRERLLAITIVFLMMMSFFLHLSAFGNVVFKDLESENNQTEIKSRNLSLFLISKLIFI